MPLLSERSEVVNSTSFASVWSFTEVLPWQQAISIVFPTLTQPFFVWGVKLTMDAKHKLLYKTNYSWFVPYEGEFSSLLIDSHFVLCTAVIHTVLCCWTTVCLQVRYAPADTQPLLWWWWGEVEGKHCACWERGLSWAGQTANKSYLVLLFESCC